jgi:MFS family permease
VREHTPDDGSIPYPSPAKARLALGVLTVAYVLSFIDRQILSLLVEPMKRDLGLTDFQVSLLQGLAFASIYCLAGLPLGRMADQFSRRNIVIWGVAFWSIMTSLCGIARTYTALLFCRAGVGVGEATLSPAAYSIFSDSFPARRLPAAMSFYNLGPAVGSGLAFMLGGGVLALAGSTESVSILFLHDLRPWQVIFLIVGVLGSVVILGLLLIEEPLRRVARTEAHRTASFPETMRFLGLHWTSLGAFFVGLSLLGIVSYATMSWYPTMFVRSFGEELSRVGLTYGAISIVMSIFGNLGGGWCAMQFADRNYRDPYVRWVLCVAVLSTAGGVLVPLVPTLQGTYVASGLLVVIQSAWMGSAVAAMHLAVPNRMRAQLTAILLFGTNIIGLTVGPSGVAALTQFVFKDPLALRYSLAIVSLTAGGLAILVLWFSLRRFPQLARERMEAAEERSGWRLAVGG